jgi:hypothetical protein
MNLWNHFRRTCRHRPVCTPRALWRSAALCTSLIMGPGARPSHTCSSDRIHDLHRGPLPGLNTSPSGRTLPDLRESYSHVKPTQPAMVTVGYKRVQIQLQLSGGGLCGKQQRVLLGQTQIKERTDTVYSTDPWLAVSSLHLSATWSSRRKMPADAAVRLLGYHGSLGSLILRSEAEQPVPPHSSRYCEARARLNTRSLRHRKRRNQARCHSS